MHDCEDCRYGDREIDSCPCNLCFEYAYLTCREEYHFWQEMPLEPPKWKRIVMAVIQNLKVNLVPFRKYMNRCRKEG